MNLRIIINLKPTVGFWFCFLTKRKSILNPRLIGAFSSHAFDF